MTDNRGADIVVEVNNVLFSCSNFLFDVISKFLVYSSKATCEKFPRFRLEQQVTSKRLR